MILIVFFVASAVFVEAGNMFICTLSHGSCMNHQMAFVSSISRTRRSQRCMVGKPDPPTIKPPPLDDSIFKGDDVETEPLFDISRSADQEAVMEFGVNLSKTYVAPIFSREVVRGVPSEIFKGALVSGAGLSALVGGGILFAGATGLGIAYVATTPGPIGDSARVVGSLTWNSTQSLLNLNEKYELDKKLVESLKEIIPAASRVIMDSESTEIVMEKLIANSQEKEEMLLETDDEATKLAKEAEDAANIVLAMLDEQKTGNNLMTDELKESLDQDVLVNAESDISNELEITTADTSDSDIFVDTEKIEYELTDTPSAEHIVDKAVDESDDISIEPELSMEDLGKAARAAVEQYEREQQEKGTSLEIHQDYNKLTVVELKDILRSRGLKVSGRKADLITRLNENE